MDLHPMNTWLVFELIGVLAGAFLSGALAGRLKLKVEHSPKITSRNRLIMAGVTLEILFSWALLYAEPVQRVLGTGPVSLEVYAAAWLGIPLIFGLDFLRKKVALALRPPEG